MAKQVIKSDGSKVPFDAKKITRGITRAAQDAKLPPDEINRVVGEVSNTVMVFAESKDKVTSKEIRDEILKELDLLAPIVAAEWRKFMGARKKK
ncbi:MAG: ATP cone domain-containing protein [Candidatus Paceibacterota bacterium]|jgi:transcriptional regulator NrdR family protein